MCAKYYLILPVMTCLILVCSLDKPLVLLYEVLIGRHCEAEKVTSKAPFEECFLRSMVLYRRESTPRPKQVRMLSGARNQLSSSSGNHQS